MKYLLALDQGTTSSRALVFNRKGSLVSSAQKEFRQYFPQPGWVEHDPEEIWRTQLSTARSALRKAGAASTEVGAIGITNQRETTVVWDRESGRAVYPAIVWQDRRTARVCEALHTDGSAERVRLLTGLVPDAYFSATKIDWILRNVKGLRARAKAGKLCFGTIDS